MNIFISHASDMLTDCKPHGDGLIADRLIRALAARGHVIHVAVDKFELRAAYPSNVTLHNIKSGTMSINLVSRLRFALGVRSLLQRLTREITFDVVHQLNPVVTGLCLALWGVRAPIVLGPYVPDWPLVVYNGKLSKPNPIDRVKNSTKRAIWQLQHRIASGIILSTPAALEKMDDPLAWRLKLHVIPYGIDTEVFTADGALPGRVILFVGHLMHHKGIFVLLEAFRRISHVMPGCRLLIAGVGSEGESAKQIADSMQDPSSIVFLGQVERGRLPNLMRQAAVVCVPSYGEAFGLVALEAMASGRPVVGTDASGLAYLITEEGGIKVQVGDPAALATALLKVLGDPELALSMGQHNRRLAEERYAWPSVIRQLEGAYCAAGELNRRAS